VHARLEQIKDWAGQAATKSRAVYRKSAPVILHAISPLAEGADRIFAQAALDLGYNLECPLPFHRQEYRNDFRAEVSKRQFDELLAKAVAVFELDGSRDDAPAAYALVGELVLDQCDMLFAIWDGKGAKGAGGTADVVADARSRRIPVVWLHTDAREPDAIFAPDESENGDSGQGIDERIKEAVWRLLLPPRSLDSARPLDTVERLLAPVLDRGWRVFERTLSPGVRRSRKPVDAPPESPFRRQFVVCDGRASQLAGLYRGAFLSNYVLGVFAVFLAIVGNAAEGRRLWPPVCEAVLIAIIIILILFLRLRQWHLRMVDCRCLAEQFRILCYSYPLGLFPQRQRLPASDLHAELPGSWVEWHSRAEARQTPMWTATLTADYLEEHSKAIRKWVQGQIGYHDRNAFKIERIDAKIHRLSWVSIGLALAAALVACVFHSKSGMERWLLFFTAGLPAASAAAHAISTQGEFPKLVDRSKLMARLLRSYLKDIHREGESSAANLRRQTENLAQVLLEEVADWQILYRKPPPPPG
jgi:hypothetical protein